MVVYREVENFTDFVVIDYFMELKERICPQLLHT